MRADWLEGVNAARAEGKRVFLNVHPETATAEFLALASEAGLEVRTNPALRRGIVFAVAIPKDLFEGVPITFDCQ